MCFTDGDNGGMACNKMQSALDVRAKEGWRVHTYSVTQSTPEGANYTIAEIHVLLEKEAVDE